MTTINQSSPTSSSNVSTATSTVRKRKKKKKGRSEGSPNGSSDATSASPSMGNHSLQGGTHFAATSVLESVPEGSSDTGGIWRTLSGTREDISGAGLQEVHPSRSATVLAPRHPTRFAAKSLSEGIELPGGASPRQPPDVHKKHSDVGRDTAGRLSGGVSPHKNSQECYANHPQLLPPYPKPHLWKPHPGLVHGVSSKRKCTCHSQPLLEKTCGGKPSVIVCTWRSVLVGTRTCGAIILSTPIEWMSFAMHVLRKGGVHVPANQSPRLFGMRGPQLYDGFCLLITACAAWALVEFHTGTLYFWLKDLTNEFLKLQVIFTALEIADKALCNFGVDAFEALLGTCCAVVARPERVAAWKALMTDAVVAALTVYGHCMVLVCQAMVFSVAINSKKRTLTALLIAANFVEIKGTVFKRYDAHKLLTLTKQDVVERFHLALTLAFVVCEEAQDGMMMPRLWELLRHCASIYGSEVAIDVIKHAILGKLNDLRPGMYREFMRDTCEQLAGQQSSSCHTVVGMLPFSAAAVVFRLLWRGAQVFGTAGAVRWWLAGWMLLWVVHAVVLVQLHRVAGGYLQRFALRATRARQRL